MSGTDSDYETDEVDKGKSTLVDLSLCVGTTDQSDIEVPREYTGLQDGINGSSTKRGSQNVVKELKRGKFGGCGNKETKNKVLFYIRYFSLRRGLGGGVGGRTDTDIGTWNSDPLCLSSR